MSGKERMEPWASSKWLSKSAAAKYIHRHVDAVQELIESGEIPAVYGAFSRGGSRTIYINIDDLDAYMRRTPFIKKASREESYEEYASLQALQATMSKHMARGSRKGAA